MKYRRFGKLGWKPSALGFGAMRLPTIDGDPAKIDEKQSIEMIRYSIDHGVNYVDTAYGYHRGNSEILVGKALQNGYREKTMLATKMPTWVVNSQADMDRCLDEQLKKLQTDHVDFYLLHGLGAERWHRIRDFDPTGWGEKALADGRIRQLGFSFHDSFQVLKEIIDSSDLWTLCQIQYNYVDAGIQAGTRGLRYAASKGLGVVIMEPIKGGWLAVPPPEIQSIWDKAKTRRTPAEWALQWVWDQPEVSLVLSGMSNLQQVVENVESADRSGVASLAADELGLYEQVRKKYQEYGFIGCTGCRYCLPCPQGVAIPQIFSFYNRYFMGGEGQELIAQYPTEIGQDARALNCVRCGRCEELCPQHLPIRDLLSKAAGTFERPRT